MSRHDVPAKHVLLEAKLSQGVADDRRSRFGGAAACQLALGGEREAADARAAVAGSLADEQEPGVFAGDEVAREPTPQQTGA